jgi:hypothetical protein
MSNFLPIEIDTSKIKQEPIYDENIIRNVPSMLVFG